MGIIARILNAIDAGICDFLKGDEDNGQQEAPIINGGHRFAIESSSDIYSWADAVKFDQISGEPIWVCQRDGYIEIRRKLPGWGILVEFRAGITLEEFLKNGWLGADKQNDFIHA